MRDGFSYDFLSVSSIDKVEKAATEILLHFFQFFFFLAAFFFSLFNIFYFLIIIIIFFFILTDDDAYRIVKNGEIAQIGTGSKENR